jgi:hypothetical protein
MKILTAVLVALFAFAANAQAATGNLTFTRPTTYVGGAPLAATDITGYEFRCTGVIGTTTGVSCTVLSLPGTALAGAITVTVPSTGGTACFTGRAFVGTLGSADSNIACKVFAAAPPNPPGNVVVAQVFNIGITIAVAYGEKADGTRNGPVVGFVPVGTPCIGAIQFAYRGQNYRRVDKVNVIWWATTPTSVVDAPCATAT